MTRVYLKGTDKYNEALALYPYVFSVKNYAYFFSKDEWEAIPFTNQQPAFNPDTQYLEIVEVEENQQVARQWVVTQIPPQETE